MVGMIVVGHRLHIGGCCRRCASISSRSSRRRSNRRRSCSCTGTGPSIISIIVAVSVSGGSRSVTGKQW